ncbi:MAG TPA: hypothetical protein VKY90_13975 [Candidatus Dormibacteraeota bacterium]|nr:hypothetical protein [Candidatus Dormibacteraeota bacterium]
MGVEGLSWAEFGRLALKRHVQATADHDHGLLLRVLVRAGPLPLAEASYLDVLAGEQLAVGTRVTASRTPWP